MMVWPIYWSVMWLTCLSALQWIHIWRLDMWVECLLSHHRIHSGINRCLDRLCVFKTNHLVHLDGAQWHGNLKKKTGHWGFHHYLVFSCNASFKWKTSIHWDNDYTATTNCAAHSKLNVLAMTTFIIAFCYQRKSLSLWVDLYYSTKILLT